MKSKSNLFSAVQPSGVLTLGNYLGSLRHWPRLQEQHNCLYCVADLHALTVRRPSSELYQSCFDTLAIFLASGIDPEKSTVFLQSHVPQHTQLSWVLNCYSQMGELKRMVQFKDKVKGKESEANQGLFSYPVLMAADILLYQSQLVPVGQDQKQHLELARKIAARFNHLHGETFIVPEPLISNSGSRIMSLQSPLKKMSKSDVNKNSFVGLLDGPDIIRRKINKALTDNDSPPSVIFSPREKPGVSNLMSLLSECTGESIQSIELRFDGLKYGHLKKEVVDSLVSVLTPIQHNFLKFREDEGYLREVLVSGSDRAQSVATQTLNAAYEKIGFPI